MKKTIIAVLAVTLVFALWGCSGDTDTNKTTAASTTQADTAQPTEAPADTTGAQTAVPDAYPQDVLPLPDDATVITAMTFDGVGGKITLRSEKPLEEVAAYYKGLLQDLNGYVDWLDDAEYGANAKHSDYNLTVSAKVNNGGLDIVLIAQPK